MLLIRQKKSAKLRLRFLLSTRIKISILLVSYQNSLHCLFYFRSVKFHYMKEIHDINSLLTLVKIVLASQLKKTTKEIIVKICWQLNTPTRTWKCARCTMQMRYSYGIRLAFQKLLQTRQTSRNNKFCKKGFWLRLIIL